MKTTSSARPGLPAGMCVRCGVTRSLEGETSVRKHARHCASAASWEVSPRVGGTAAGPWTPVPVQDVDMYRQRRDVAVRAVGADGVPL